MDNKRRREVLKTNPELASYICGFSGEYVNLGCTIHGLKYDYVLRTGHLYIGRGECCDMASCIRLFMFLWPHVNSIETWAKDRKDTQYHRIRGKWYAVDPEGRLGYGYRIT
jgi:hypothetical protein